MNVSFFTKREMKSYKAVSEHCSFKRITLSFFEKERMVIVTIKRYRVKGGSFITKVEYVGISGSDQKG